MRVSLTAASLVVVLGTAASAADWPQWQGPDRTRVSKETGLLKEWPTAGPPVVWTATGLGSGYGSMAIAGDRVYLQGAIGRNSGVIALNRADGKVVWAKAVGISPGERQRRWTAQHAHRRRRSPVRAHRERRPGMLRHGRRHPVAAKHPQGVPWPADPVADQRIPTRRWTTRRRVAGRVRCGHGEAGQDDGRDRVDIQGPQRSSRVFLRDRRRCGRCAHLHDVHGLGRCRRACL